MHRFFVSPSTITNQGFTSDDPELCHQLFRVLKLESGEHIVLCDNTEHEYRIELTGVSKTETTGKIFEKKLKPDISTQSELHLFLPPLKNPSRWEWMVEKCTEIGVTSFTPILTERTEVKVLRKIDRLERIIKEAAELSGRTKLPVIHEPLEFKDFLNEPQERNSPHEPIKLIATLVKMRDPSTAACPERVRISGRVERARDDRKTCHLFLGPVGDFTPAEIDLALKNGYHTVSLGTQILRTETAAIVAASLFLSKYRFH